MDDNAFAAGFVRNVLGCGCPDEILLSVQFSRAALGPMTAVRLNVGGRLLVCVPEDIVDAEIVEQIPEICAIVRRERDHAGFNRARLVLGESGDAGVNERITQAFGTAAAGDERLLLHILPRETISPLLAAARARSGHA